MFTACVKCIKKPTLIIFVFYYLVSRTNSLINIDQFIKFTSIEIESTNGFKTKNWKSQLLAFNQPKRESFDELTGRRVLRGAGGAAAARE